MYKHAPLLQLFYQSVNVCQLRRWGGNTFISLDSTVLRVSQLVLLTIFVRYAYRKMELARQNGLREEQDCAQMCLVSSSNMVCLETFRSGETLSSFAHRAQI